MDYLGHLRPSLCERARDIVDASRALRTDRARLSHETGEALTIYRALRLEARSLARDCGQQCTAMRQSTERWSRLWSAMPSQQPSPANQQPVEHRIDPIEEVISTPQAPTEGQPGG